MLTVSWCNFNFQWSKWIDYCENWIKVANIGHSTINTLLLLRLLTVRILQEGQTHFTYYVYYIGDLSPFWLFCLKALWFSFSQRFLNDLAFKYYLLWAYLMKAIPETRLAHWIWYLRFYFYLYKRCEFTYDQFKSHLIEETISALKFRISYFF